MFWILVNNKLSISKLDFMKDPEIRCNESELLDFIRFSRRLAKFEPVQYITGVEDFMGLELKVSPSVLIPRPETEELVTWVVETLNPITDYKIIDIGTGSGCIPLSLKKLLPKSLITGVDVMQNALDIAIENKNRLNIDVRFVLNDALNMPIENDCYDIVVSNPPYVLESEKLEMSQNVLNFEPHTALFVENENPLLFYEAIANWSVFSLIDGGYLFFEINEKYAQQLERMLVNVGFKSVQIRNDIFDKPRMIRAQK